MKNSQPSEDLNDTSADHDLELGLTAHLAELRSRLLIALSSVLVCFLAMAYWAPQIFNLIASPLAMVLPKGAKMIVTDVTGSFITPLKVTLYVSLVVAMPIVLYQLWAFVAPGLYRNEKRLIFPLVLSSYLLFMVGIAFASFFVLPSVFKFMAVASGHLQAAEMATDIDKYLSFVLNTYVVFGLSFEVPVLVFLLVYSGVVSVEQMQQSRRYVILIAFIVAAIVTPPDVLSQFMLAIPLWFLFEIGLLLSRLTLRRVSATSNAVVEQNP